jgi:hypothetical protein
MLVKVIAVLLFIFLNRRMLTKDILKNKIILFYGAMIAITIVNIFIQYSSFSLSYLMIAGTGIVFWLLCAGSTAILLSFVKKTDTKKLHDTLTVFFALNAAVTFMMLLWIIIDAGAINPYTYQGMYQKYFISTGDRMMGISFDTSTTNAIFNAFAVVYFLSRRQMLMVLLCTSVLILTSSNVTNLMLILTLVYLFIFQSDRDQKSIIIVCFIMLLVFLVKISPQNNASAVNIFDKIAGRKSSKSAVPARKILITEIPDSLLNENERKQKLATLYLDSLARVEIAKKEIPLPPIATTVTETPPVHIPPKPSIPHEDIHSAPYQMSTDTTLQQRKLLAFALQNIRDFETDPKAIRARRTPGKIISFRQTFDFFKQHPQKLITGCGTGRFSSKLAFRASGLGMSGGFPKRFVYIDTNFLANHLNHYITYFTKHKELHSLIHTPNSVYDQLVAEYGIAGVVLFVMLYIAFFLRRIRKLTYGVALLIMMMGALAIDYWFEQLSIVILFELLMLLNIKESEQKNE